MGTESDGISRRSERITLRVIDKLFAFVGVLDATGTLLDANEAPLAAAGITIDDVRGKKFWDCTWWSYSEDVQEQLRVACERAARGEVVRYDVIVRMAGDTRMTIDFQVAPLHDEAGRVTHLVPSAVDITERKRAEAALRESEVLFRALADNIAQLAWMTDETGYIFWYNRRWFEFTGTTLEEMKGWGWQKFHHPEHVTRVTEKFRRHVASGEPWEDTFPLRSHAGRYRWFLSRAFPLRDDSGRVVRWFGTNTDITSQREAEEALREADRRKDEFIAILAHELRNPLAPVRSAVEVLRRLGQAEPRLDRARDIIDRQVTHMARLIDDLLDVSRITRGKLALQRETCDLATIARLTAEDYRATLEAAGLRLVVSGPAGPLWVDGDPVRLAQMIGNLLNNAARFTDKGGLVEVRAELDDASRLAVVSVADTGVGIEPALLSRLFDPFSQAHQDLARSKGGLGLGLALTKGLAELHGGGVAAHSGGPGRGSTFTLRIPLSKARDETVSQGSPAARDGGGLLVLVIEDNEDAAEMLYELLQLGGHEVKLAFNGAAGVAAARELRPRVVISDIGLPGELDGYAVARALRAEPALQGVYLIALSGYADEDARRRSREAGFDVHIAKPADIATLERALADVGAHG